LLLSLLIASAVAGAPDQVLEPSGKWSLEYNDDACLLARPFGSGEQKVTFGFKPDSFPAPERAGVTLLVIDKEPVRSREIGPAHIEVPSTGKKYIGTASSRSLGDGTRIHDISIDGLTVDQIGGMDIVSLSLPKRKIVNLNVGAKPGLVSTLNRCRDDFAKSVGVDLAIARSMVTPAEAMVSDRDWIRSSDYPEKRNWSLQRGVTAVVFTIGVDGHVSKCDVVLSSGDKALDNATCNGITSNARYKPALDKDGKAIQSYATRKVIWAGAEGG
jgi:hypothetical protein